jgi:hypothetical protein
VSTVSFPRTPSFSCPVMGRKAAKTRAAASRAKKKAQQSELVELSDSKYPDIDSDSPANIDLSGSEAPAAVELSNDDFTAIAITEVSHD